MRIALLLLTGFVALTALGGGLAVATGVDPFPAEWLLGTPFSSYLVPGLMLAGLVGGSGLVAFGAVLRRRRGAEAAIVAGTTLTGWITGEAALLNQPSAPTWIEIVYFCVGLAIAGLGVLGLRKR